MKLRNFIPHFVKASLFGAVAIFLTIALVTYNHNDSSFNIASDNVQNYAGLFGTYIADLFYQIFGLGSFIIVISLYVWSIALFFKKEIRFLGFKLISIFMCLSIFCYLSDKLTPNLKMKGGLLGWLFNNWFNSHLNFYIYYQQVQEYILMDYLLLEQFHYSNLILLAQ
jgi:hypothetical protein